MNYRINPKNGDSLSILAFGCMRFAKDESEVERQIIHAIEQGVNYFDTAYIYPSSEVTLGKILAKGYRQRVKIATKLPHYLLKKTEDFDRYFNEHLKRLQTDYIDYYLIHMLSDVGVWQRLQNLGIEQWIQEKKASGQIRNIGFSYHGGKEDFIKLIDAYAWEFCMIQYNYMDEHNQAGKSGLQYAASKGLPVMIMEPLRGGKLVTALPREVEELWQNAKPKRTPAEWALRWVWNHPEVTSVLSGMNSMEMLNENIEAASTAQAGEFSESELDLFEKVRQILLKTIRIPCTGCNYCMPCPFGVDIPLCLACTNDVALEGRATAIRKYIMQTGIKKKDSHAGLCTQCGLCETKCPQKIPIRQALKMTQQELEGFWYRPARGIIKRFMGLHKEEGGTRK